MTSSVTLNILLNSGLTQGGFCVPVVNDGNGLELTVKRPSPLVDLRQIH